jgi:hypothetical protein
MVMMVITKNVSPFLWLGAGIVGVSFLSKRSNKALNKLKEKALLIWCKEQPEICHDLLMKVGHPDPYDMEDNRMVDEGAIFGVHYYNQKMH